MAHPSTKQILKHLIDDLPDDATIADVQYHLYIIDAVNRGRDEIASGAGIPHFAAMRRGYYVGPEIVRISDNTNMLVRNPDEKCLSQPCEITSG